MNWKVFRLMQEDVEKQTGKKLLNVGSVAFMGFTTPLGMDVLQRSGMLKLFLQVLDGSSKILLPTVRISQP